MLEKDLHSALTKFEIALAAVSMVAVSFVRAPYGRHNEAGWGPQVPVRAGWMVMESPAVLFFLVVYVQGSRRWEPASLVLLTMWIVHYVQRTVFYPLMQRGQRGKTMPLLIVVLALAFNTLNAYVNARWISHIGHYDVDWLTSPMFMAGAALFIIGFATNLHADAALRVLRKHGEGHYALPRGWLFDKVSSPNYFGEIVEWTGWAVATRSMAGLAFALYSVANLAPRAKSHHAWYRRTFKDYPTERRALIPYVW